MGQGFSNQDLSIKIKRCDVEGVKSILDEGEDPNCRGEVSFPFFLSFFIFHFVCLSLCLLDSMVKQPLWKHVGLRMWIWHTFS